MLYFFLQHKSYADAVAVLTHLLLLIPPTCPTSPRLTTSDKESIGKDANDTQVKHCFTETVATFVYLVAHGNDGTDYCRANTVSPIPATKDTSHKTSWF